MSKNLAQIIRDNPGAVAIVDNDGWWLRSPQPAESASEDEWDRWHDSAPLASDNDVFDPPAQSLETLAGMAGITVEPC